MACGPGRVVLNPKRAGQCRAGTSHLEMSTAHTQALGLMRRSEDERDTVLAVKQLTTQWAETAKDM